MSLIRESLKKVQGDDQPNQTAATQISGPQSKGDKRVPTRTIILIGIGVFVLFAEFFKSGDIGISMFLVDVISSVVGLVIATILLCYLAWETDQPLTFYHWFGYAILLGDTILSPFNAFRTALRNFGVGTI